MILPRRRARGDARRASSSTGHATCRTSRRSLRTNIRTTNILRTLCDLGALDRAAVPGAVGHVVTTGLASPAALSRRPIDRHARRGRPGVPALRDALDEWVLDGKPVDSVLEPAMRRLLAAATACRRPSSTR